MTKEYQTYIQSDIWKNRARIIRELDGFKCQMCSASDLLDVHHFTYQRFKREDVDDLISLCRLCHERITLFSRVGMSADEAWERRVSEVTNPVHRTLKKAKEYAAYTRTKKLSRIPAEFMRQKPLVVPKKSRTSRWTEAQREQSRRDKEKHKQEVAKKLARKARRAKKKRKQKDNLEFVNFWKNRFIQIKGGRK